MLDVTRICLALGVAALACGDDSSAQPLLDAPLADAAMLDAPSFDAGVTCTADCECEELCCEGGSCRSNCGRPSLGLCGSGDAGTCRCEGGTCDVRLCCLYPDGGIDNGFGSICMPPDAG
jgi:hypothetical protein